MAKDQQADIVRGTANLFEDLGYADSERFCRVSH